MARLSFVQLTGKAVSEARPWEKKKRNLKKEPERTGRPGSG